MPASGNGDERLKAGIYMALLKPAGKCVTMYRMDEIMMEGRQEVFRVTVLPFVFAS